jgi:hypothetical protein
VASPVVVAAATWRRRRHVATCRLPLGRNSARRCRAPSQHQRRGRDGAATVPSMPASHNRRAPAGNPAGRCLRLRERIDDPDTTKGARVVGGGSHVQGDFLNAHRSCWKNLVRYSPTEPNEARPPSCHPGPVAGGHRRPALRTPWGSTSKPAAWPRGRARRDKNRALDAYARECRVIEDVALALHESGR